MIVQYVAVTGCVPIEHGLILPPHVLRLNADLIWPNYFVNRFNVHPFPDPGVLELDVKSKDDGKYKKNEAMIHPAVDK